MKRFLPAVVFLVVTILGAGITWIVYQAIRETAETQFRSYAHEAVDRVTSRVDQHLSLLEATDSYFVASKGNIPSAAFQAFVSGLDIEDKYDGIQGIGYAEVIQPGDEQSTV
ncbi:MAG: hypothetical protein WAU86_09715, partial [Oricola sp.]